MMNSELIKILYKSFNGVFHWSVSDNESSAETGSGGQRRDFPASIKFESIETLKPWLLEQADPKLTAQEALAQAFIAYAKLYLEHVTSVDGDIVLEVEAYYNALAELLKTPGFVACLFKAKLAVQEHGFKLHCSDPSPKVSGAGEDSRRVAVQPKAFFDVVDTFCNNSLLTGGTKKKAKAAYDREKEALLRRINAPLTLPKSLANFEKKMQSASGRKVYDQVFVIYCLYSRLSDQHAAFKRLCADSDFHEHLSGMTQAELSAFYDFIRSKDSRVCEHRNCASRFFSELEDYQGRTATWLALSQAVGVASALCELGKQTELCNLEKNGWPGADNPRLCAQILGRLKTVLENHRANPKQLYHEVSRFLSGRDVKAAQYRAGFSGPPRRLTHVDKAMIQTACRAILLAPLRGGQASVFPDKRQQAHIARLIDKGTFKTPNPGASPSSHHVKAAQQSQSQSRAVARESHDDGSFGYNDSFKLW